MLPINVFKLLSSILRSKLEVDVMFNIALYLIDFNYILNIPKALKLVLFLHPIQHTKSFKRRMLRFMETN